MSDKIKGVIFSLLLATSIVIVFFGKIIQSPNEYYFSAEGDGFKAYYGAIYHLEHDSTSMRMNGMNYPYGEMVFFTGCQPLVVNAVKFISNNIVDISGNIVGIINLLMVFSIVVAALFLFLVFYETGVNWLFASLAAVGICMLSPQIARFGGHFSLSWLFWIPLMIYLIIRFDKKPSYLIALLIGLTTFLAGAMHMYFYGFFGFIIVLYLVAQVVNKNRKFGFAQGALFFLIQYLLPFVIFNFIISGNDVVSDRTEFPYGFWAYRGHPVGVLFPSGRPYAFVPQILTVFKHVGWESLAFIGMAGLGAFLYGIVWMVRQILKLRNPLQVTDNFVLNVLFWSSFIALLFSFGLPFTLGLEGLVDKIGPLKQLRALARFSWLFFYMINIVLFYNISKKLQSRDNVIDWRVIGVVALGFLLFDGSWNMYINSRMVQNKKPLMTDKQNKLPANDWVNQIDPKDYQAILPIPYFHVGSENIWIESKHGTQEMTMIASLKTGLPITAVQLSRTSIEQTYKNYALVTEPLEPFEILKDLPSQKPFLLLFNRKHYPDENEERLLKAGNIIYQNEKVELRSLRIEQLVKFYDRFNENTKEQLQTSKLFDVGEYLVTDTSAWFAYKSFDEEITEISFAGSGALEFQSDNWTRIFNDTIKVEKGKKITACFWMYDYKKDGHLRNHVEIVQKDIQTQEVKNYFFSDTHRFIQGLKGKWALIEIDLETQSDNEFISIAVRNSILKGNTLILDELLIRENKLDVYKNENRRISINTRPLVQDY